MHDRLIHLSLTRALAYGSMALGVVLSVLPFFVPSERLSLATASLGMVFLALGAVLVIKSYLCALNQQLSNAYELGRLAEREGVRNLRR